MTRISDFAVTLMREYALHEPYLLYVMACCMIICGVLTFLTLTVTGLRAAYGRYADDAASYIPWRINARLAWFVQEIPAFIIPCLVLFFARPSHFSPPILALVCFIAHYAQRSFIYSFLIRGGKPTPVHTFFLACVFCAYNGFLQARFHVLMKPTTFGFSDFFGFALFVAGMKINIQSDSILRNLRKPRETGYRIPRGGFFEYVSAANFFGEILEWIGYAMISRSLAAWAFALFTFLNLAPRARHHHQWYLQKFEDYPKNRTAVIPFLF